MPEEKVETKPDTRVWMYGPNDQSQIFDHPEQVPEGWHDHPSKVPGAASPSSTSDGGAATGNGAASDHTLSGNDSINRGNPQGEPQGSTTQGGESGQPTDQPFVMKPIDDVDKNWIIQHLNSRKVPNNPKWNKQKLYDLLRDAVSPAR